MKSEKLFTTGEFAKLHGINKRTLQYYDGIGLFTPAIINEENNYRYYSSYQSPTLEMLLLFRQLGLSIDDIKCRLSQMDENTMASFFIKKQSELEDQIRRLRGIQKTLGEKAEMLSEADTYLKVAESDDPICSVGLHSDIEIIRQPGQNVLLCPYDNSLGDEENFQNLMQELGPTHQGRIYARPFGTMISVDNLRSGQLDVYDYLFIRSDDPTRPLHTIPAGPCLRAYSKGRWDNLKTAYEKILAYADEHKLQLYGYAYETGLNDFCAGDFADYVTRILIPIRDLP